MQYTVTIDSQDFELPRKTMKIAKLIDSAHNESTSEASYRKQFDLVKTCLGDKVVELLGSDKIDEIDLVMLTIAFIKIENAYLTPVDEVQAEIDSANPTNKTIEQLTQLGDSIGNIGNAIQLVK